MGVIKSFLLFMTVVFTSAINSESIGNFTYRDGYFGVGYKLQYKAQPWGTAKLLCEKEHAKLAVPKTIQEFQLLQQLVRGLRYNVMVGADDALLAWVGVSNIDDYRVWRNVDGEDIRNTAFHTWAGDNGVPFNSDSSEPHCAGVDAINHGLRTYWCNYRLPYICQINVGQVTLIDTQA